MDGEVIDVGGKVSGNLVDIDKLPPNIISAMLKRLSEKSQRSTQIFDKEYSVSLSDIENLLRQLAQELQDQNVISSSISVSAHLSSNQRFDFSSWEEFKAFDSSQAHRTKSLAVIFRCDILDRESNLERYRVQMSIQNVPSGLKMFLGPVMLRRIEDAGLPPVPIHLSVDYTNFIRGKNLLQTVEKWVDTLEIQSDGFLNKIKKYSHLISAGLTHVSMMAAILGGYFLIVGLAVPPQASIANLFAAAAYTYAAFVFSRYIPERIEVNIDARQCRSAISLTKGDQKHDEKIEKRNRQTQLKWVLLTLSLAGQVACSLAASRIYEWLKS